MHNPPRKSFLDCIRNFTWAWHTVVMGTGALATLTHSIPFGSGSTALKTIYLSFFFVNLLFFVLISLATIARYIIFPETWKLSIGHNAQSLFIGAAPMGLMTVANGALIIYQDYGFGGRGFLYFLWGVWWFDSIFSIAVAFGMLFVMITRHQHSMENLLSLWLLPVVTLIVASSGGGLISVALAKYSTTHALITIAVSFTEVFIGITLSLMIITGYLLRLIIHGPPGAQLILSSFVILGPLGQSGFSLLVNSHNLHSLLPDRLGASFPNSALVGHIVFSICCFAAWTLWSMSLCWIVLALSSIYFVTRKEIAPFSVGYWGMIFPNAVFAALTLQLGRELNSDFFRYFGTIYAVAVVLLWAFVLLKTIPAVFNTSVFAAPYLKITPAPQEKISQQMLLP